MTALIRINENDRIFLRELARTSISCPTEEAADKAAYTNAAPIVRKMVEDRYPPKDMKLLAKYHVASPDICIRMQLAAGGVVEFKFRDEKEAPLASGERHHGCRNRMFIADEAATSLIQNSLDAAEALKDARGRKLNDYYALISASVSLDQIEGIWPAASALRPRKGRSLPVVLSDEVIARIKADAAPLKKAA